MFEQRKRNTGLVPKRSSSLAQRHEARDEAPIVAKILKSSLFGALLSAGCAIFLISVLCAASLCAEDPGAIVGPVSLIALLPSMFIGGFFTAKQVKESPVICGIVCGAIITLLSTAVSLIFHTLPSSSMAFLLSVFLHSLAIAFCIIGALAGNTKKKYKPKFKRYR